jgi:hypothetical protein
VPSDGTSVWIGEARSTGPLVCGSGDPLVNPRPEGYLERVVMIMDDVAEGSSVEVGVRIAFGTEAPLPEDGCDGQVRTGLAFPGLDVVLTSERLAFVIHPDCTVEACASTDLWDYSFHDRLWVEFVRDGDELSGALVGASGIGFGTTPAVRLRRVQ